MHFAHTVAINLHGPCLRMCAPGIGEHDGAYVVGSFPTEGAFVLYCNFDGLRTAYGGNRQQGDDRRRRHSTRGPRHDYLRRPIARHLGSRSDKPLVGRCKHNRFRRSKSMKRLPGKSLHIPFDVPRRSLDRFRRQDGFRRSPRGHRSYLGGETGPLIQLRLALLRPILEFRARCAVKGSVPRHHASTNSC